MCRAIDLLPGCVSPIDRAGAERTLVELTGSALLGPAVMPGPVLHMASAPAPGYDGVPSVGEHTTSVLSGVLDLSPDDLAELAGRGIIGPFPPKS